MRGLSWHVGVIWGVGQVGVPAQDGNCGARGTAVVRLPVWALVMLAIRILLPGGLDSPGRGHKLMFRAAMLGPQSDLGHNQFQKHRGFLKPCTLKGRLGGHRYVPCSHGKPLEDSDL